MMGYVACNRIMIDDADEGKVRRSRREKKVEGWAKARTIQQVYGEQAERIA